MVLFIGSYLILTAAYIALDTVKTDQQGKEIHMGKIVARILSQQSKTVSSAMAYVGDILNAASKATKKNRRKKS